MSNTLMLIWMVVLIAIMYFLMIRPQKKEQNRIRAMLADMAVGDSVVTTSCFYGVVIDITEEDVIIEFGNNRNCRIPILPRWIILIRRIPRPLHWLLHLRKKRMRISFLQRIRMRTDLAFMRLIQRAVSTYLLREICPVC